MNFEEMAVFAFSEGVAHAPVEGMKTTVEGKFNRGGGSGEFRVEETTKTSETTKTGETNKTEETSKTNETTKTEESVKTEAPKENEVKQEEEVTKEKTKETINEINTLENNFAGQKNSKASEVLKRIPKNAVKRILTPQEGKVTEGVEYKWTDSEGKIWRLRIHGPDSSAPEGSNSKTGWVFRVQYANKYYMDSNGNFHLENVTNPRSPMYNESIANDTHIPIINDVINK
jgi:hypothetical protein